MVCAGIASALCTHFARNILVRVDMWRNVVFVVQYSLNTVSLDAVDGVRRPLQSSQSTSTYPLRHKRREGGILPPRRPVLSRLCRRLVVFCVSLKECGVFATVVVFSCLKGQDMYESLFSTAQRGCFFPSFLVGF